MPKKLAAQPEAVVEGVLYPGEICIIAGAPSVGKSRFQLHMLYGLALGAAGWWGHMPAIPVLYCSQRSWKVTSAQLRTVGIRELPDTFQCFCPPDLTKAQKQSFNFNPLQYLDDNVIAPKNPPKVIVLDTLITYLPHTRDFNFNNYSDLTKGCDEIYYWAQHWGCAVPIAHHTAKQKTDSKHETATEKILGSQAIMAIAISACILEHYTSDDPTYLRIHFMSHLDRLPSPRYFHGDDFREVAEAELATFVGASDPEKVKLGATETKVLEEIPFKPIPYSSIAVICGEKLGISRVQVYRILDNLTRKKYVITAVDPEDGSKVVFRERPQ
ncbi:MAG: AAA family ATPase [Thermodesulfovibrionales bacterium]|jgi:hypothetical protein